jgi:hypothetical protein
MHDFNWSPTTIIEIVLAIILIVFLVKIIMGGL